MNPYPEPVEGWVRNRSVGLRLAQRLQRALPQRLPFGGWELCQRPVEVVLGLFQVDLGGLGMTDEPQRPDAVGIEGEDAAHKRQDRKSVGKGKRGSVRVAPGGRSTLTKKIK